MAIYHATTKPISRSSGRSSTASSAYRAGVAIEDKRTGLIHDYSSRGGVIMAVAFAVQEDGKIDYLDRDELWNKAELAEKRKDARTAREWILAIPSELVPDDLDAQRDLAQNKGSRAAVIFAKEIAKRYGVGVDIAIHAPDAEGNNRNYHAHIMTTTRQLSVTDNGIELGDKATIELSNAKRDTLGLDKASQDIKELRKSWADIANGELEENGFDERIDHRSHAERGIIQQPTIKMGWKALALERKGIATDRGDINRNIKVDNKQLHDLELEIVVDRRKTVAAQQKAPTPIVPSIPAPKPILAMYYSLDYQEKVVEEFEEELDELPAKLWQEQWDRHLYNRDKSEESRDIVKKMARAEITPEDFVEVAKQRLTEDNPKLAHDYEQVLEAQSDSKQLRRVDVEQEQSKAPQPKASPNIRRPKPR